MRLGRVAVLVASVVAALVATSLGVASAQTATGGFGAAPAHSNPADPATRAYFKPVLAPGASFSDEVLVTSASDTPLQLLVSAVDGLTGQTSGAVYANRDAPVTKTGAWVTPSISALSLAPHAQALVPFTVSVPAGATPGDHLAGVAIENANPQRSGSQFAVTTVIRTVVGVDITVPGPAEAGLRLGKLALKALPGTGVATLSMQLGDNRGKLVKPLVAVSLRGPGGYRRSVTRQLDTILPGDTIAYPFIWPDSLVPGDYYVVIRATGGPEPIVRQVDLRLSTVLHGATHPSLPNNTSGFPLAWALAIGLALILAIVIGSRIRRHRGRRAPLGKGTCSTSTLPRRAPALVTQAHRRSYPSPGHSQRPSLRGRSSPMPSLRRSAGTPTRLHDDHQVSNLARAARLARGARRGGIFTGR